MSNPIRPVIRFLLPLLFVLVLCLQGVGLQRCATPTPPNGGARDTLGPVLLVDETTPNFQTNFRPEQIVLTFDEWVELDPKQEILISPPLSLGEENRPYLRRRSLIIPLQGLTLRDSVTYVVNVGEAVKDLNEGNPTENLRFVFATGPVLDSATVSGQLLRDYSGEPLEKGTFTLYGNLSDTAATTENPTYFAQTDEEGRFTVYNVRPGTYRAIALERNPSATNYYIDTAGFALPLAIGFLDTLLSVADGANDIGTMSVSAVASPLRINGVDTSDFGRIRLVLNQPANTIDLLSTYPYRRRNDRDSLDLYYTESRPDTLVIVGNGAPADTLIFGGSVTGNGPPPRLRGKSKATINPSEGLEFRFDRPVSIVDSSGLNLSRDSLTTVPFSWSLPEDQPGVLRITSRWVPGGKYVFTALPASLKAVGGTSFPDTLNRSFSVDAPERYGIMRINLVSLDTSDAYIFQLIKGDETVELTRRIFADTSRYTVEYPGLPPATYRAELIFDANRNGRYDGGDFFLRRQPEKVRRFDLPELRANWEVEEEINLKN